MYRTFINSFYFQKKKSVYKSITWNVSKKFEVSNSKKIRLTPVTIFAVLCLVFFHPFHMQLLYATDIYTYFKKITRSKDYHGQSWQRMAYLFHMTNLKHAMTTG